MTLRTQKWLEFVNRIRTDDDYFESFSKRFWDRTNRMKNGCLEWTGYRAKAGYGSINIFAAHCGPFNCHRVAWALSHRDFAWNDEHILHHCDNPPCCDPEHLFDGTMKDNMHDCISKGRFKFPKVTKGELCPTAKLTDEEVRYIVEHFKPRGHDPEFGRQALAKRFGVSGKTIYWTARLGRGDIQGGVKQPLSAQQKEEIIQRHQRATRKGPNSTASLAREFGVPYHAIVNLISYHNRKSLSFRQ